MSAADISNPDRDAFMAIAWRDFIKWASTEKDLVAQFNSETGRRFMVHPRSPLEALVDAATGRASDDAEAFIEWVTVNWWGLDEAPEAYRAHLHAREGGKRP
ncbi:hypothetical protein [Xanthobacter sediminis]